jgi:glycosyltransferase involved in cell wall biosynthesis
VAHAARALCVELIKDQNIKWEAYVPRQADWDPETRQDLKDRSSSSLKTAIRRTPCDLLFVPSGAVSAGLPVPAIPWVHDLIIFDHPEWFPQGWLKRQFTTRLFLKGIKKSPLVFAVSEYTKQAIIRRTRLSSDRIIVTGEGGDETLSLIKNEELRIQKSGARTYCLKKMDLPCPFVLCLGTLEPRKNLAMLIRAWSRTITQSLEGKHKPCSLVIAGQDGWHYDDVEKEIAGLPDNVRPYLFRLEKVTDEQRRQLLLATQAVAVPSLDEGFGLVALEALQAGTPVMASGRGALPEVVGKAGMLIDPLDEDAWSRAILKIVNPERPKIFNSVGLAAAVNALKGKKNVSPVMTIDSPDVMEAGRRQSERFSWEKSAAIVLDSLKGLSS